MRRTIFLGLSLLVPALFVGGCASAPPRATAIRIGAPEPWVQTELFIGLSKSHGGHVNRWEWAGYESTLARDFPDGFTILDAQGGWADGGKVQREASRVIVVCYPQARAGEMNAALQEACTDAIRRLGQVEVLRVDTPAQVSMIARSNASATQPGR